MTATHLLIGLAGQRLQLGRRILGQQALACAALQACQSLRDRGQAAAAGLDASLGHDGWDGRGDVVCNEQPSWRITSTDWLG